MRSVLIALCLPIASCTLVFAPDEPLEGESPGADGAGEEDPESDSPPECPSICSGGCDPNDGTCVVECGHGQCGVGPVVCPAGLACRVNCIGDRACENAPIDCSAATRCEISCIGSDACDTGIDCGGSECTVLCVGDAACEDGAIRCAADVCNITCDGQSACASGVCCAGADCGTACTSANGGFCGCR